METPRLVRDIMTSNVVTLFEEDNLAGIESMMERFRFRHLPVVDEGKLVGLVTHRNVLRAAASSFEVGAAMKTQRMFESLFVRDVMERGIVTVNPDTPILDAGRLLWNNKMSCLPVVDDAGKLVGIVTEADFVKLSLAMLEST